jgi:hypothetical protein
MKGGQGGILWEKMNAVILAEALPAVFSARIPAGPLNITSAI